MRRILLTLLLCVVTEASGKDILVGDSQEHMTLISGHEEAFTEEEDFGDIYPAHTEERCKSCGGKTKSHYKKCGNRGNLLIIYVICEAIITMVA